MSRYIHAHAGISFTIKVEDNASYEEIDKKIKEAAKEIAQNAVKIKGISNSNWTNYGRE